MNKLALLILITCIAWGCDKSNDYNGYNTPLFKVTLVKPYDTLFYTPGDKVEVQGKLETNASIGADIQLQWISDKDGVIKTEKAGAGKDYSLTTTSLSRNIHKLHLVAINSMGYWNMDSITIYNTLPQAVTLNSVNKNTSSLTLNWEKSTDKDFLSYEVYRSTGANAYQYGKRIGTINDINNISFTDTTVYLNNEYHYQVVVKNSLLYKKPSNELSAVAGIYLEVGKIYKMLKDPKRNYVYLLSNVLMVLNTTTMALEGSMDIGGSDMDIDKSGNYLYLGQGYDKTIKKIDLNSRTVIATYNTGYFVDKVACGEANHIYFHVGPRNYGTNPVISFNTITGQMYGYQSYGGLHNGELATSPDCKHLYCGQSFSSMDGLVLFNLNGDDMQYVGQFGSGYTVSFLRISKTGSYIYWNQQLLDDKLQVISSPSETVYDFNTDDTYAICGSNIITPQSHSVIKEIHARFNDALFINNNELLLYNAYESSVWTENKYRIFKYAWR